MASKIVSPTAPPLGLSGRLRSLPEVQAEIQEYLTYCEAQPDGALITWDALAAAFQRPMPARQRGYVRKALKRLRRPYESVPGEGIRLSSPGTALTIMQGRLTRIDGAVLAAERTQRQLQERHLELMHPEEQRKMLMLAGFFGAIRGYSQQYKQEFAK